MLSKHDLFNQLYLQGINQRHEWGIYTIFKAGNLSCKELFYSFSIASSSRAELTETFSAKQQVDEMPTTSINIHQLRQFCWLILLEPRATLGKNKHGLWRLAQKLHYPCDMAFWKTVFVIIPSGDSRHGLPTQVSHNFNFYKLS